MSGPDELDEAVALANGRADGPGSASPSAPAPHGPSANAQSSYGTSAHADPAHGDPEYADRAHGDPEYADPATAGSAYADPAYGTSRTRATSRETSATAAYGSRSGDGDAVTGGGTGHGTGCGTGCGEGRSAGAEEDAQEHGEDEVAAPAWLQEPTGRGQGHGQGHEQEHGQEQHPPGGGRGSDRSRPGGSGRGAGPYDFGSGFDTVPGSPPATGRDTGEGAGANTGVNAGGDAAEEAVHDLPWPRARAYATRTATPLPARTLPLDKALGHTLAAPLEALTDLPSFDTSAMDGWAVSGPGPWELTESQEGTGILAGERRTPRPLHDGRAVRIATGARLPEGASAVLRFEYGAVDGGRLAVSAGRRPEPGTDIRPRGQECRSGDRLLGAGVPVSPAVLGLAAAAGYDALTVTGRPRAEVLVLGDELLYRGQPRDGRIRDALGPMVAPWLAELGADVLVTRRLGDDAEALYEAVSGTTADLLVTTGGTAHGPVDHVRPTLHRAGARLLIDGVRVRPGHPMLLARLPGRPLRHGAGEESGGPDGTRGEGTWDEPRAGSRTSREARPAAGGGSGGGAVAGAGAVPSGPFLVGLPGNPLAALSGLMTLAAPLLRTLSARPAPARLTAALTDGVHGHPRDTRLVPVVCSPAESTARPLRYSGPAMLRGIASASALAVVPPGGAAAGTPVRLLSLPWSDR